MGDNVSVRLIDRVSQACLAKWSEPAGIMGGYWSRDGREFYLGGHDWANLRTGLWVYDVDKKSTLKVLSGPVFSGQRTRDGRRLLLRLHSPYYELWAVDLDPALSTIEALGPGRTLEEHYQEMANLYTRAIEVDPADASAYSSRTVLRLPTRPSKSQRRHAAVVRRCRRPAAVGCGHAAGPGRLHLRPAGES